MYAFMYVCVYICMDVDVWIGMSMIVYICMFKIIKFKDVLIIYLISTFAHGFVFKCYTPISTL